MGRYGNKRFKPKNFQLSASRSGRKRVLLQRKFDQVVGPIALALHELNPKMPHADITHEAKRISQILSHVGERDFSIDVEELSRYHGLLNIGLEIARKLKR